MVVPLQVSLKAIMVGVLVSDGNLFKYFVNAISIETAPRTTIILATAYIS